MNHPFHDHEQITGRQRITFMVNRDEVRAGGPDGRIGCSVGAALAVACDAVLPR